MIFLPCFLVLSFGERLFASRYMGCKLEPDRNFNIDNYDVDPPTFEIREPKGFRISFNVQATALWIRLFYKINEPISSADIDESSTKIICYPEENFFRFYMLKKRPEPADKRKYYCIDKNCRLHRTDTVFYCLHLLYLAETTDLHKEVYKYFNKTPDHSHEVFLL